MLRLSVPARVSACDTGRPGESTARRRRTLERMIDATSARQLHLLGELAELLGGRDVPFWLRGGWALDFLLGAVTRRHADIDLVAWLSDRWTSCGACSLARARRRGLAAESGPCRTYRGRAQTEWCPAHGNRPRWLLIVHD